MVDPSVAAKIISQIYCHLSSTLVQKDEYDFSHFYVTYSVQQIGRMAEWLPQADQDFKNSLLLRLVTISSNFTSTDSYMFQINIGN